MDSYLDIRLLPDPEFLPTVLMNVLFEKLHRGLVELGRQTIGVSFPDIREGHRSLGKRLRLHGSRADLQHLMLLDWTRGLRDHIEISEIVAVPQHVKHRVVRRVQAKSNPERLRRRLIARKQIDADAARRAIPDDVAEFLRLPHVVLSSNTTGQRFKLFIEHSALQDEAVPGRFGAYGLSPTSTVPWF